MGWPAGVGASQSRRALAWGGSHSPADTRDVMGLMGRWHGGMIGDAGRSRASGIPHGDCGAGAMRFCTKGDDCGYGVGPVHEQEGAHPSQRIPPTLFGEARNVQGCSAVRGCHACSLSTLARESTILARSLPSKRCMPSYGRSLGRLCASSDCWVGYLWGRVHHQAPTDVLVLQPRGVRVPPSRWLE